MLVFAAVFSLLMVSAWANIDCYDSTTYLEQFLMTSLQTPIKSKTSICGSVNSAYGQCVTEDSARDLIFNLQNGFVSKKFQPNHPLITNILIY